MLVRPFEDEAGVSTDGISFGVQLCSVSEEVVQSPRKDLQTFGQGLNLRQRRFG